MCKVLHPKKKSPRRTARVKDVGPEIPIMGSSAEIADGLIKSTSLHHLWNLQCCQLVNRY